MNRRFVILCGAAFAVAFLCLLITMPPFSAEPESGGEWTPYFENTPDLIDLNTAPAAELRCLPGIGEKRAQAIVEYRAENGPFTSVEQLADVKGISASVVEGLRALVTIS